MQEIQNRLTALRAEMKKLGLDAYFISGTDPHSSEYLPERWQTRAFISGFTGSYGMVVITHKNAGLWTDSRYFIQADEQLAGSGITMHKLRVPGAITPEIWLNSQLKPGNKVGIDAQCISVSAFRNLESSLSENNIGLVQTQDLLDLIWENRPAIPSHKVFELALENTGKNRAEKQQVIADRLEEQGADFQVVSMLDELAWMFNLRGEDVSYNPVFIGFGLIGKKERILFIEKSKLPTQLFEQLKSEGISIYEYGKCISILTKLKNKKIFIDSSTANYSIYSALFQQNEIIEGTSVIAKLKSRKNKTELQGFKDAMKKDGVALVEFLFWLKNNLGKTAISEYDIGVKLKAFRSKQEGFKCESFPPIVGYKEHGAIVHLSVGPEDALPVNADGILLFDSGGQYLNGTTDITRTIALGEISEQQKIDYTLVLKGMIALTQAKFPVGTKGAHLDILARKSLWENGINYGHGTGHGVGHFLNVHEGPMAIRQEFNPNPMESGMVLSNEPAMYREGEYGIRTENMMYCVEKEETEFSKFLGFETLTICPIDKKLINKELISKSEIDWLNDYHVKVRMELQPFLKGACLKYLEELTSPV